MEQESNSLKIYYKQAGWPTKSYHAYGGGTIPNLGPNYDYPVWWWFSHS